MPSQTPAQQQSIIKHATKDGSLDSLYWFIEVDYRVGFQIKSAGTKINGLIQVIPVSPCAETSAAEAELLRTLCERAQAGTGKKFSIALTDRETLQARPDMDWCEWGDKHQSIDNICPECGAVHTTGYEGLWSCCGWSQAVKRSDVWFVEPGHYVFKQEEKHNG